MSFWSSLQQMSNVNLQETTLLFYMEGINYLDKLSKWFKKFKRYTVKYKKGAFHLHHLFNSPETTIESFDKMPFCKHDRKRKIQITDSIFITSKMFYCNPEVGLWAIISNLYFKKNVLMENLYDKDLPIEHHFINIHIKTKTVPEKSLVNGLVLKDNTWSMFKAGHALTEYHFKNSNEKNITLFFTSKWLERQKEINPILKNSKLIDFFDSKNTHLILDEESPVYEKLCDDMMFLAEDGVDKNLEAITKGMYQVFINFIEKMNTEIVSEGHFKLNDKDRKTIQRVEQYLGDNLIGSFPGIEKTAEKFSISPTKLKADFKSMHNTSLYQYFSKHQMQAAHQLLIQNKYNVKEIAALLGYENASKFSARFKEEFGSTPSSV